MLVPTYSQAEHLRYALLDRTRGLGQKVIHTFTSLAEQFGGCRLGELVPEARRDRIAGEVLQEGFGAAAAQPGLRTEFLSAVKEIKEQGTDLAVAVELVRAQFEEGHRARLMFEAAFDYSAALAAVGKDHEDLLLETRDRFLEAAPPLDLLLVDGFHDFTPVQKQIIDLLAAQAGETVVTLPVGDTAARTADSFKSFGRETLKGNHRASGLLAEVEANLFQTAGPFTGDSIRILAAASHEDEADRLARHVAGSGRPPKDFLLVRRSFGGLHDLYRAAFDRFGIPLRIYGPEPLASGPLGRALEIFLRTRFSEVPARDLLPLLRSPFLRDAGPNAEADNIASAIRKEGERVDWSEFPESAKLLAPSDKPFASHFSLARALIAVPDGDLELGRAARLLTAFGQEADAVAGQDDAARVLLRRLPQLRAALPDRRHNCVYAVEAKEARQWEKKVVLVAGLDASSFPHAVRQDLFLRDDERKALAERGFSLPLRERREDEERYLFYVALTRAREEMVLSWAAFDEEGTAVPQSPFLEEARALFPDAPERKVKLAEQYVPAQDAVTARDLLPIVADGLARVDRGGGALAAALYDKNAVPRAELARPQRLELLRALPLSGLPLDPAAKMSASRLKRFNRCPYLMLMGSLLRVEPARDEALDPLLRGNIVHDILEKIVREKRPVEEVFDEVFDEKTAHLRLGLDGEAEKRRMRGMVSRGADTLAGADVIDVEEQFVLALDDGVNLRGRIDRIDRLPQGELVRDYKTGMVKQADDIQLDAYLVARPDSVGAVFDLVKRGGMAGFLRDDVEGEYPKKVIRISAEDLEQRRAGLHEEVMRVAALARAGRLNVQPEDPEMCTRDKCDGYDLCRVNRARWFRKAERRELPSD